ncbi:MAG: hypothetical protein JW953_02690 [Anaerolineae bacterium]|nr:hypothetical protein [Anaerolineae bacterium]
MLKRRIIAVVAGLALLLAVAGSAGVVADAFGLAVTSQSHACTTTGASGGGC